MKRLAISILAVLATGTTGQAAKMPAAKEFISGASFFNE